MAAVSKIHIALEAQANKLNSGLTSGLGMIRKFAGSASGILGGIGGSMFTGIFQGIGQRLAHNLSTVVGPMMESIDGLAKQADLIGIGTAKLTAYRHAAGLAGISNEALDGSLLRMTRRLALAADGGGPAADSLKQLGLSAQALSGLTADQKLKTIADAFENVRDQGKRSALAFDIFGQSGMALPQMLRGGSAALEEAEANADKLGFALSRVDAARVELANDAIANMNTLWQGFIQQVTVALAPTISAVAETLTAVGNDGRTAADRVAQGFEKAGGWLARLADIGRGLQGAFDILASKAASFFGLLARGLARLDSLTGDRLFGGAADAYGKYFEDTAKALEASGMDKLTDAFASKFGNQFRERIDAANREAERIAATVADRLDHQAVEEEKRKTERRETPAALQQGTTEAYRAIQAAQRQEASKEEIAKRQLAKQEEEIRLARRTAEAVERLGVL